jgi:molecular chaperone IbpA
MRSHLTRWTDASITSSVITQETPTPSVSTPFAPTTASHRPAPQINKKSNQHPLEPPASEITSPGVEAIWLDKALITRRLYPIALGGCGMRTLDYSPLFRSTVGFDRLFDLLDNGARPDWPPYNIEKHGENEYRISMAIAGFAPEEIDLVQQGNTLTVSGEKHRGPDDGHEMLHQGLAFRNFRQTFNLAAHVKVESASLQNGLLSVQLVREIPEQLKPRQIKLNSDQATISSQDNQLKLGQVQAA